MRMELIVRFDYGSIVPWVRRVDGVGAQSADPMPCRCGRPCPCARRGPPRRKRRSRCAREDRGVPPAWHPSHEGAERHVPPMRALEERAHGGSNGAISARCDGEWRDGRAAVPHRAQSPDLRADRRHRRRRDHVSARTAWEGPQLGLPVLLAARRDVHALLAVALRVHAPRRRRGVAGCCARLPATRRKLQIMYGPSGERRLTELTLDWLPGYEQSPSGADRATPPSISGSWTSTARSLDTLHVALAQESNRTHRRGRFSACSSSSSSRPGREPDEGIWEVRGRAGTSRTRR